MIRRVFVAAAGLAVAAMVILAALFSQSIHTAVDPAADAGTLFTIERGEPFQRVTERLAENGLIERPRVVALYGWLRRYDRHIHAGTYWLSPGDTPLEMLHKFVTGDIHKVAVTVPEGLMQIEIAGVLAAETEIDSATFAGLRPERDVPLDGLARGEGAAGPSSLEGYLFPDTYNIPWGMNAQEIAGLMVRKMNEVFGNDMRKRAASLGLTTHEALTLASIIEAETGLPDEHRLVSAVYHNRLRKGMRLEADPTVAYAKGGYRGRLYYKDLEIDSPYNTYLHPGLPPGPICNPGRAAIVAALDPDTTCTALYFVARGDGGHIFSQTLEDHLAAVRKVRQARRSN